MDVTTLLRCTRRIANRALIRTLQKILVAAAMLAVAGCAQVAPEYDPINWISAANREVSGWFGDETPAPPIVQPPPAEGRPFPNLGTVPPPPLVTTGQRTQRETEQARLEADRAAAAKADAALRAQTAALAASQPGAAAASGRAAASAAQPAAPPSQAAQPPASAPAAAAPPSGNAAPSSPAAAPPSGSGVVMPQYGPNSLPPSLLPSTPVGAAPAPVIELPSVPPALASSRTAAKVASLLTTSERQGSVSFSPEATTVSAAGRNTLDAAAAAALENAGSVRLVPAEIDDAAAPANLVERRIQALRAALASAGLPKDRVTIVDVGGRRVDVYDVYVDY
jgi:outer membrane protein OmpA-like peptidoglycan-associated protein